MSTAGSCRPNGRLNEETGTAFIARTSSGQCILLSALHCFLEDEDEDEDEEEMEISGVAVEEELARPRLASRKEKVKKSEIDLQLDDPAKLKQMIEESGERLLKDRILSYTYWFCYKEVDQHVELKGSDFVAEHVRVEYSVVSMQHGCEDAGSFREPMPIMYKSVGMDGNTHSTCMQCKHAAHWVHNHMPSIWSACIKFRMSLCYRMRFNFRGV